MKKSDMLVHNLESLIHAYNTSHRIRLKDFYYLQAGLFQAFDDLELRKVIQEHSDNLMVIRYIKKYLEMEPESKQVIYNVLPKKQDSYVCSRCGNGSYKEIENFVVCLTCDNVMDY